MGEWADGDRSRDWRVGCVKAVDVPGTIGRCFRLATHRVEEVVDRLRRWWVACLDNAYVVSGAVLCESIWASQHIVPTHYQQESAG